MTSINLYTTVNKIKLLPYKENAGHLQVLWIYVKPCAYEQHYNNNLGNLIFFKLYWTNLFKRH